MTAIRKLQCMAESFILSKEVKEMIKIRMAINNKKIIQWKVIFYIA